MAKNKKNVIPASLRGKVFNSFGSLGAAMGITPSVKEDNYTKECKLCGAGMVNVPGTNVWVCPGKNDKGEDCGNRLTARVRPAI